MPGCRPNPPPTPSASHAPEALHISSLPNAHRLAPHVIAGGQPAGADAFQALRNLDVKLVISVDGAKPDIKSAEVAGLQYIHLPIGYDTVPVERQQAIAKAILSADGPVYIHCHHGKHRSAAAAAAACVVAGLITNEQAVEDMKAMQSGGNYTGLWQSAREAQQVSPETLDKLKVDFQAIQPMQPLTEAMVHIDECHENLLECKQNGWQTPKIHPDIHPAHEALQLREQFAEIQRTADFAGRPADFQMWTRQCEVAAKTLEERLREWEKKSQALDRPDAVLLDAALNQAFETVQKNCTACHQLYRNVPQPADAQ